MLSQCTFLWISFAIVDSHSLLTEKKAEDGTSLKSEIVINNLQNQINQETVIRLSLLKQVYSLVNDMINVKNEMAAMKTNTAEIRKSTDDLRHEDNKMLSEIEQLKHDHNDKSGMIINSQLEHNKKLSKIEQKMNINHNDTSERIENAQNEYKMMLSDIEKKMKFNHNDTLKRIANAQNGLLKVNNSVGLLSSYTEKIKTQYIIQENRMKDLSIQHNKTQSTLSDLQNEDQRILSEMQRMFANHSKITRERIRQIREDLEESITSMIINQTLTKQDCLKSSHCWLLYSFEYDNSWNGCEGGAQYVTKTNYSSTPYLGVMTCSSKRYKLFLSKTLTGKYYNIADMSGSGEDHCELLGTTRNGVLPGDYRKSPNTQGFYRSSRGDTFLFGTIGYTPKDTGYWYEKWIECGVNIPGSDRVVPFYKHD